MTPLTPERRQQILDRLLVAEQHAANKTSPYKWWSTALRDALQHIETLERERDDWKGRAERQYDENIAQIAKYAALEQERDELRRGHKQCLNDWNRTIDRAEKAEGLVRQAWGECTDSVCAVLAPDASEEDRHWHSQIHWEASTVKRTLEGYSGLDDRAPQSAD